MTWHHLLPRQKGGKAGDRVPMCRPCHKQIHATFSNTQLAREYVTIQALRQAEAIQPFLRWIRRQHPSRSFRTVQSSAHPRRGR
jgi:5-methylcytosine-specific restriction enzyme A